jgi:hypothetical protein
VTAFFMLGLTFDVKASGQTYLISAPKTQITLLLAVILVLYGLWAGVFLFLQTPNKKKI